MKSNTRASRLLLTAFTLATLAQAYASPEKLPVGFKEATRSVGKGVSLHYVKGGKGEPILLVHGFGETAHMWRPLLPVLAKNFTVIAPDLPGLAGSSFLPSGKYEMKEVAQHLHELIKRLGYKRIRLVGHDIGLMAVYAYAAQYPDEVGQLVLMDAPIPGIGDIWDKIYTNPVLWHFHYPTSPISLKLVKGRERIFLDHFWMTFSANQKDVKMPESDRQLYAKLYAKDGAMKAALGYFLGFEPDAVDNKKLLAKGKLPMPVLTIEGDHGMGGALEIQAKQAASDVKSILLKNTGHWMMEERRKEVTNAITGFFGSAN